MYFYLLLRSPDTYSPAFFKYELEELSVLFSCIFLLGTPFKSCSEFRFSGLDTLSRSGSLFFWYFLMLFTLFSSCRELAFSFSNSVFRDGGSGKDGVFSKLIGILSSFSVCLFLVGVVLLIGCIIRDVVGELVKSELCRLNSLGCKIF